MSNVISERMVRARQLAAQIESWSENTPIQTVADVIGNRDKRRLIVDGLRGLLYEKEGVTS